MKVCEFPTTPNLKTNLTVEATEPQSMQELRDQLKM
jgi:hypothetical protein